MNTDSGHIYNSMEELLKEEKKQGLETNLKHLIRFGLGDTMEIRGASFEIIEIKPHPENIIVLKSRERGIY